MPKTIDTAAIADRAAGLRPWPALMKKATLADYIDVHTRTIDRMVAAGTLPAPVRVGSDPRWPREQVDDAITKLIRTNE